jgi:acylphosphatase
MLARRFLVHGRVPGVGYRFFTQETASALGLRGYVRNLPDGSVEAWAEGELPALEKLHGQLLQGPAGARVSAVNVEPADPTGSHESFRITR